MNFIPTQRQTAAEGRRRRRAAEGREEAAAALFLKFRVQNDRTLNLKLTLFTYVRIFGEYPPSVAGDVFGHYIWCVNP